MKKYFKIKKPVFKYYYLYKIKIIRDFLEEATRNSEATKPALLVSLLTVAGVELGAKTFLQFGDSKVPPKLFCAVVGKTSIGRKGTSFESVKEFFSHIVKKAKIEDTIINSGEGIIRRLRDRKYKFDRKKGERVLIDEGVRDKRITFVLQEFSSLLVACNREGSTASQIIRTGWDKEGNLSTQSRNPLKASNTHFGIIGHITQAELVGKMNQSEKASGFVNRFLWVISEREKNVDFPEPGNYERMAKRAGDNLQKVKGSEFELSEKARKVFIELKNEIEIAIEHQEEKSSSLFAREPIYSLRLSIIFAALDGEKIIRKKHIFAAKEFLLFCRNSALYIFNLTEVMMLEENIQKLKQWIRKEKNGQATRTEISSEYFQRNKNKEELNEILLCLKSKKEKGLKKDGKPKTTTVYKDKIKKRIKKMFN